MTIRNRALLLFLFAFVCGTCLANPVPLINQPLVPNAVMPGSGAFTLTVNGTGFVSGAVVNWNGNPQPTNYISTSQLTATIAATELATESTASITVTNPTPGGGISNVLLLEITNPAVPVASTNVPFGTDTQPTWIAVADLNSDGRPDLVTANVFDTVSVILGNGDGTFQEPTNYPTGPTGQNPDCVAAADVNRDGILDLVVLNAESKQMSVLLGNGDGTFQGAIQFPTGGSSPPQSLVLGDFNGDGNLDAAVTDLDDSTVSILLGNGDGTFQPAIKSVSGTSTYIVAGDFNRDDILDLAVINADAVAILLGNGDGTFQAAKTYPAGSGSATHLIAADFNQDGKLDLAVENYPSGVSILLGNGDGSFQQPKSYVVGSASSQLWAMAIGDLNGDGILDLEFSDGGSGSVEVLFGNGDGTFQPQAVYATAAYGPIGPGDFTNSGRLDLAVASRNGSGGVVLLQAGYVGLSTTALSFGNVNLGAASTPQNVTLTNTGSAVLKISSITVTGSNSSDFSEQNTCSSIIAVGGSCAITVTFMPAALGSRSAFVSITDNAPGSPQMIALTGTGVAPAVMLSPASLTFATQLAGTSSKSKQVTLMNTGTAALVISNITTTGPFTETNTCGTSLAIGASCTINIVYKPTAKGSATGSVSIVDNASGSPQSVSLTGTGTVVSLSTNRLNFPSEPVGMTSAPESVTLTNTGKVALTGSISIAGADAQDFSYTTTCPQNLAPGVSCAIRVKFTPKATGTRSAILEIADNGGGSPQKVALNGTGS